MFCQTARSSPFLRFRLHYKSQTIFKIDGVNEEDVAERLFDVCSRSQTPGEAQLSTRKSQLTACLSASQPFRAARPQKQLLLGIISLVLGSFVSKRRLMGPLPYLTPPHQRSPTPPICVGGVGGRGVFADSYRRAAITALHLRHPTPRCARIFLDCFCVLVLKLVV